MQTTAFSAPLRGAFFRPPAKPVLEVLTAGCPLRLEREPDNAYDVNAIKALVKISEVPESHRERLKFNLESYGFDLDEMLSQSTEVHLGYVGKEYAETLAPIMDRRPGEARATLSFSGNGKPEVQVVFESESGVGTSPGDASA